ncbi:MAG: MFS transporter [Bacteroidota bacterium]
MTSSPPLRAAAVLIAMLSATTILSQFFRSSTNVIAPELIRDLSLTSEALGLANSAFFLALLAVQVPVGILFDRIGPRLTVAGLAVLSVVGALMHAVVASGAGLTVARFLLGLGHGGSFMSTIVLCSHWYPRERWSTAMSWVFGLSMLGVVLAGTPLALASETVGWRSAFVGMAVVSALVGLMFFALVRDDPPGHVQVARRHETAREALTGFIEILRLPGILRVLGLQLVAYSVMAAIMGLWAGPYLHDVHGLDAVPRGNVLIAMAVAQTVGVLAFGPLDRAFDTRKWVAVAGAATTIAILLALAAQPRPPAWLAVSLLVALCAASAYGVHVVTHARTFYPPRLVGRGATTANMAQLIGCALLPIGTGFIPPLFPITAAGYSPVAYQLIFATIAAVLAAGLAVYLTAADARPSAQLPAAAETRTRVPEGGTS